MAVCSAAVPLLENSAEAFLSRFCFQSRIASLVAFWASDAALCRRRPLSTSGTLERRQHLKQARQVSRKGPSLLSPYAHAGLRNFFVATCPSRSRRASAAGWWI